MLDEGVAATVAYAREHSAFYRARIGRCPGSAECRGPPILAADHQAAGLRAQRAVLVRPARALRRHQHHQRHHRRTDALPAHATRHGAPGAQRVSLCFLARWGSKPGDVAVLGITIDKCFMAGLAYFEGLRRMGVTAVRVGAGSPAMLLSMVERLRATAIVSVPSFLKRVAAYAKQQGLDPAESSVRKLVCIGEPVRDADGKLSPLGADIATAWNAQVFSTYGITELASSLCECVAGRGGHLHPELLHIEIVDDAGHALARRAVGQLVATTIGVEAMPVIRFATPGDMTFMTHEPLHLRAGDGTDRADPGAQGPGDEDQGDDGVSGGGAAGAAESFQQIVDCLRSPRRQRRSRMSWRLSWHKAVIPSKRRRLSARNSVAT